MISWPEFQKEYQATHQPKPGKWRQFQCEMATAYTRLLPKDRQADWKQRIETKRAGLTNEN